MEGGGRFIHVTLGALAGTTSWLMVTQFVERRLVLICNPTNNSCVRGGRLVSVTVQPAKGDCTGGKRVGLETCANTGTVNSASVTTANKRASLFIRKGCHRMTDPGKRTHFPNSKLSPSKIKNASQERRLNSLRNNWSLPASCWTSRQLAHRAASRHESMLESLGPQAHVNLLSALRLTLRCAAIA